MKKLRLVVFKCVLAWVLSWGASMVASAKQFVWWNGSGHVEFSLQKDVSPVVHHSLLMFSDDMLAVTGHKAVERQSAKVQIYQLDKTKNKEFKQLAALKIPVREIIAKKEAFFLGVVGGRLVVVGSDARGTAYGILQLSRLAGVSPWMWWNDIKPQHVKALAVDERLSMVAFPSVEKRSIKITNHHLKSHFWREQLDELMLRLRVTDVAEDKTPSTCVLTSTMQPGLLWVGMRTLYNKGVRQHWVAEVPNLKKSAYQLQLFMDMAWNIHEVCGKPVTTHLQSWYTSLFGPELARRVMPIMQEYYRLVAMRSPDNMEWGGVDTEFNADAFGNELERYLFLYDNLKKQVATLEKTVDLGHREAFFAVVKYPVFMAADEATKVLQAQETRHLARSTSFHMDADALASAVRSINAWREMQTLHNHYEALHDGRWKPFCDDGSCLLGPALPDKVTDKEVQTYTRAWQPDEVGVNADGCTARNASEYFSCKGTAESVAMLGHSNKAMVLHAGSTLDYQINMRKSGAGELRVGLTPVKALSDGRQSLVIRIDDDTVAVVPSVSTDAEGKQGILRNQIIVSVPVQIPYGTHTLTMEASGGAVVIDQWMIDYKRNREFYLFPIEN